MRSSRGRRTPSHDAAILHSGGWGCDVAAEVRCAEIAGAGRRRVNAIGDLRVAQRGCGEMLTAAIDALAIYKRVVRSHRDRVRVTRVTVIIIVVPVRVEIVKI